MMLTVLCGGVGGVKLALGLTRIVPADEIAIIVNTADDLIWHGLYVSPDVDTVLYTLAGVVDTVAGWGIAGDTAAALDQLTAAIKDEPVVTLLYAFKDAERSHAHILADTLRERLA